MERGVGGLALVLTVGAYFVAAAIARSDAWQETPTAPPAVSSQILGTGPALTASDHTRYLYQVTVEPGAHISLHVHPGTQVASIAAGELTYPVLHGEAQVTRASRDGTPGPVERATSGQEVVLRPGDWLAEQAGTIHQARNAGNEPVVILISSRFPAAEPMSRLAEAPATPAAEGGDRWAGYAGAAVHPGAAGAKPASAVEIPRRRPYHVSGQYGAAEGRGLETTNRCVGGGTTAFPTTGAACLALMR